MLGHRVLWGDAVLARCVHLGTDGTVLWRGTSPLLSSGPVHRLLAVNGADGSVWALDYPDNKLVHLSAAGAELSVTPGVSGIGFPRPGRELLGRRRRGDARGDGRHGPGHGRRARRRSWTRPTEPSGARGGRTRPAGAGGPGWPPRPEASACSTTRPTGASSGRAGKSWGAGSTTTTAAGGRHRPGRRDGGVLELERYGRLRGSDREGAGVGTVPRAGRELEHRRPVGQRGAEFGGRVPVLRLGVEGGAAARSRGTGPSSRWRLASRPTPGAAWRAASW